MAVEERQHEIVERRLNIRGTSDAHLGLVFAEGDVTSVVQVGLNAPVLAHQCEEGRGLRQFVG
jgi:hypothetical protein